MEGKRSREGEVEGERERGGGGMRAVVTCQSSNKWLQPASVHTFLKSAPLKSSDNFTTPS